MKISITNFKSIKYLNEFEIKPLTILSGINSTGKSSFIQLLLLLKQTLEIDSSTTPLFLNGDYYKVEDFKDVISGHNISNKLKITFSFSKQECIRLGNGRHYSIFDSFSDYNCFIDIGYDYFENSPFVNEFAVRFILPEGEKKEQIVKFNTFRDADGDRYIIETNNDIFVKDLYFNSNRPEIIKIGYSSFYPSYYETLSIVPDPNDPKIDGKILENYGRGLPNLEGIKSLLGTLFKNISYIGPLRENPKDQYAYSKYSDNVGPKGENSAQILQNNANQILKSHKVKLSDEAIEYHIEENSLIAWVKFWMCEIFKVAVDIYTEKVSDVYKIILVDDSGLRSTIKHVGFGISQILPIIIEGLRIDNNSTLLLEQPEIHLHPKLQSLLFDFLFGLVLQGKSIIIETHSDHLITRMRRRIAENIDNSMIDKINLTFIETSTGNNLFKTLEMNSFGTYEYFPKDFIEQSNIELKAILKAQMQKRIKTT